MLKHNLECYNSKMSNKICYGIIGNGLMARHFTNYLTLESIPFILWCRKESKESPENALKECPIILLLISDGAIDSFIISNPWLQHKKVVHFSGALNIKGCLNYHPLMTFSKTLYSIKEYRNIPFIGIKNQPSFLEIFPTLKNCYYQIDEKQKPLYHALCVISGNFTNILWHKTFKEFEDKLNLPKEVLMPYLEKTLENIQNNPLNSLTGPIRRNDKKTIYANIKSLQSLTWKKIYKLFVKAYKRL